MRAEETSPVDGKGPGLAWRPALFLAGGMAASRGARRQRGGGTGLASQVQQETGE